MQHCGGTFRLMRAILPALLLVACGSGSQEASGPGVQLVAFGDSGNASANQAAVGEAMGRVCAERGCDLALMLGDNFYPSGVTSIDDAQFETKFETPYRTLKGPVWVTLGNHDNSRGYGEGSDNARGDNQVDYHYLAGRRSEKWQMPARYYNFTAGRTLAEFFSLDSNPLTAITSDPDPAWAPAPYQQAQQDWLSGAIQESKAKWKVAFAHHPYLSNGLHGNAGNFDGQNPSSPGTISGQMWKEMLDATVCAQGVDLLITGHDHDLQHLQPVASCGKTHFIVSGAAEGPRPFGDADRNVSYWQQDSRLGFFWLKLAETEFTVAAYLVDANNRQATVAYERTYAKP
jgi:predicted phosphodiesterase